MRLRLKLSAEKDYSSISHNYNYALSSAIYKLLHFSSPEFSDFLHNIGYRYSNKAYKLFTFYLSFGKFEFDKYKINILDNNATLYVSSPMVDDFIKNFVIGTFVDQTISIYSEYIETRFEIEQTEMLPEYNISPCEKFICQTPVVFSTVAEINGKTKQHYLQIDDDIDNINRICNNNLKNKYELIIGKSYEGAGITLTWDNAVLDKQWNKRKFQKKISILKDLNNPIDIVGIKAPFYVEGDPELIRIGYSCGFGEKNSMGFGFVNKIY